MRLIRYFLLWLILSGVLCKSVAQINTYGYPSFNAYKVQSDATTLFYDIAQDNRGVVYVISNDRLIKFSGSKFEANDYFNNYPTIAYEPNEGKIYIGGPSDFGYLTYDNKGRENFVSLVNTLPEGTDIEDAYFDDHIYVKNDSVFFLGRGAVVVYDIKNNKSERWPIPELSRCAAMGSGIYTTDENNELCLVTKNGIIPQGAKFDDLFHILLDAEELSSSKNVITGATGVYTYDKEKNRISLAKINKFSQQIAQKTGQADKIKAIGNNRYGISNRGANKLGSVIIVDSTFTIQEIINKTAGVRSNVSLNIRKFDDVLWTIGYDVTSVAVNSPVRRFTDAAGYSGDIISVFVTDDNTMFVLTTECVYVKKNEDAPTFIRLDDIDENATSIYACKFTDPYTNKDYCMIGSTKGLYFIDKNLNVINKSDIRQALAHQFKYDPKHIYIYGTEIKRLNVLPNLKLEEDTTFVPIESDAFYSDNDSILWTRSRTLLTSRINVITGKSKDFSHLGKISGIPTVEGDLEILSLRTTPTHNNLVIYDPKNNSIEKCNLVDGIVDFNDNFNISALTKYGNGYLACSYFNHIFFIIPTEEDPNKWESINVPFIPDNEITRFTIAPDSTIYAYTNNTIYSYYTDGAFKKLRKDAQQSKYAYNAIINKVHTDNDTIFHGNFPNIHGGTSLIQPDSMVFTLPYNEYRIIRFEFSATCYEYPENTTFSYFLEGQSENWSEFSPKAIAEFTNLHEGNYTFKVKANNVHNVESTIAEYKFIISPPFYRTIWAYIFYMLLIGGIIYLIARFRTQRLIKRNHNLQRIVEERTRALRQHEHEILSNINYASRIQKAVLTPDDKIAAIFPQHFVFYKPHTIVSGDFYVITEVDDKQICVVADCTGHGVSGGFLSMLGISVIRQIVLQTLNPAEMLDQLRQYVISNLHQKDEAWSVQDGMDASVFVIDKKTKEMSFAGANSRILIYRNNEEFELKGDRMPVAIHFLHHNRPYTNITFQLKSGDMIYAFSDGYIDQFGGEDNSKFMISRFKEILHNIHEWDTERQKETLIKTFEEYKGSKDQTDDVLVMGVRIE